MTPTFTCGHACRHTHSKNMNSEMAKKHMKPYSASFFLRKMQTKTTRYNHTAKRMAKTKKVDNNVTSGRCPVTQYFTNSKLQSNQTTCTSPKSPTPPAALPGSCPPGIL